MIRLSVSNCPELAVLHCEHNFLDIQNDFFLQAVIGNMFANGLIVSYDAQKILVDKEQFDQDEYNTLLDFMETADNLTVLGWDKNKPGEWSGVSWRFFDGRYRVTDISLEYKTVKGSLDLSGFTALSDVDFKMTGITSVILPNTMIAVKDGAFYDCSNLTRITLPDTLLYIGSDAFYHCTQLAEVLLPDGLIAIGDGAFRNCTALSEIVFPSELTTIGDGVYFSCLRLTKAVFMGDAPNEFDDDVFSNTDSEFTIYYHVMTQPVA